MKITLLQENLDKALKVVAKAIPSKPQLPILSSLLLVVEKDSVTLAATDLYLGVRAKVEAKVEAEGSIALPAKLFVDSINSLSPGEISLEHKDSTLTITTSKTSSSIQTQASDDYPTFPDPTGQRLTFSLSQLEDIEKYVSFSSSTDQTRLVLTTVSFKNTPDCLEVVATDGFRLSYVKLASLGKEEFSFLVPAKAIQEVVRIASQQEVDQVDFNYAQDLKQLFFVVGGVELFVRLVEGDYPPYEKILPTEFELEIALDTEELNRHLKQAVVFSRDVSNVVNFEVTEGELILAARSATSGSFEAKLPVKVISGKTGQIAFNAQYILDFIGHVKPESLRIGVNDQLKPALFREEGNDNFKYIAMPFRLNE